MIRQFKIPLVSALALVAIPLTAYSQAAPGLRELLVPVDQKSIDALMSPSNYELRAQLYTARRFRIVNVNFDVFDKGDAEFTVSPFADLQMTLVATPEKYASAYDQLREWKGELKYPELRVFSLDQPGAPARTKRIDVTLWLRTGDHEIPLKLVREIAEAKGDTATFGPLPKASTLNGASDFSAGFGKMYLRTLNGYWLVPELRTNIVIRPIDGDPRFHIVYEEDYDKMAAGTDVPDAETTRKLEAAGQFLKALEQERIEAMGGKKQN